MTLPSRSITEIRDAIQSTKMHPWKPRKSVTAAVNAISIIADEHATDMADQALADAKYRPQIVEDKESLLKLRNTHQYVDRMRNMIQESYDEGENDPSILLANIEGILAKMAQDDLR